ARLWLRVPCAAPRVSKIRSVQVAFAVRGEGKVTARCQPGSQARTPRTLDTPDPDASIASSRPRITLPIVRLHLRPSLRVCPPLLGLLAQLEHQGSAHVPVVVQRLPAAHPPQRLHLEPQIRVQFGLLLDGGLHRVGVGLLQRRRRRRAGEGEPGGGAFESPAQGGGDPRAGTVGGCFQGRRRRRVVRGAGRRHGRRSRTREEPREKVRRGRARRVRAGWGGQRRHVGAHRARGRAGEELGGVAALGGPAAHGARVGGHPAVFG
ncbi:hypothetical protein DFJ74DRAFT_740398, partial [Hyaloraphidium curvatum]